MQEARPDPYWFLTPIGFDLELVEKHYKVYIKDVDDADGFE